MNPNTATPTEIDTEISRLHELAGHATRGAEAARKRITYLETIIENDDTYRIALNHGPAAIAEDIAKIIASEEVEIATAAKHNSAAATLNAEWVRRGCWTRVFLVTNSNGHVHNTTSCRNCYDTTQYHWVTALSGATDAEIVEQAGERTCLSCFPSVRAEIVAGRKCRIETPAARASREEREEKAARKAEEKRVKGITNPDGSDLFTAAWSPRLGAFRDGDLVKTEVAANRQAMAAAMNLAMYGLAHPERAEWVETRARMVAALAHKRGTSVEVEAALIEKKTAKKLG